MRCGAGGGGCCSSTLPSGPYAMPSTNPAFPPSPTSGPHTVTGFVRQAGASCELLGRDVQSAAGGRGLHTQQSASAGNKTAAIRTSYHVPFTISICSGGASVLPTRRKHPFWCLLSHKAAERPRRSSYTVTCFALYADWRYESVFL